MPARCRVVLFVDHHTVREVIKRLFEKNSEYAVIGEFARGQALLDASPGLDPDLYLLGISLPDLSGLEVLHHYILPPFYPADYREYR
jgi:DNA-binding NarL/FixJ family response regulator